MRKINETLDEMTSRYVGARLLSFAGSVADSKRAESEIRGIEAHAEELGLLRNLKNAVLVRMYGVSVR
jgi:hypothetical protein